MGGGGGRPKIPPEPAPTPTPIVGREEDLAQKKVAKKRRGRAENILASSAMMDNRSNTNILNDKLG